MSNSMEDHPPSLLAMAQQMENNVTKTNEATAPEAPKKLPNTHPAVRGAKKLAAAIKGEQTKAARRAGKAPRERAAPKEPAANARPDGLRKGSKMAVMLDMVLRPEGATEAAICKKLGWQKCRVTLKRTCDKVGATLEGAKPEDGGPTVYRATMPPAKKKAAG